MTSQVRASIVVGCILFGLFVVGFGVYKSWFDSPPASAEEIAFFYDLDSKVSAINTRVTVKARTLEDLETALAKRGTTYYRVERRYKVWDGNRDVPYPYRADLSAIDTGP